MDLLEQVYITTIADCGSITRAASILHISQPALSKFLNNVEQRLGCALFYRNRKMLRPTKYGELYLEKARQILHIAEEFHRELALLSIGTQRLELNIGIQSLRAPRLAPCLYSVFAEAFPTGHLQVLDGTRSELIEMLQSDSVDLILTNDVNLPEPWDRHPLRQDRLVLVSGNSQPPESFPVPGEQHPTVDVSKLGDRTFLMLTSQHSTYLLGKRILVSSGISPNLREGAAKHEATLNMVALGTELSFTLDSYLPMFRLLAPLNIYNILQEPNKVDYDMCCKPDRFPPSLKRQLQELLSTAVRREQEIVAANQLNHP